MRPTALDPDGKLDVGSLHQDVNYVIESGQITAQDNLSTLIDASFQEAAVHALGPYQRYASS